MANFIDNLEKDRKRAAEGRKGKWEELRLKCASTNGKATGEDAKIAKIRFITDLKDAEAIWVHEVPQKSRLGSMWKKPVYCMSQDGQPCEYCKEENRENDSYFAKRKILLWVYVYHILHVKQNAEKTWQRVEYLDNQYYKEEVNAVRLLNIGPGFNSYLENKFLNWFKRFKTLVDRDYEWTREGYEMNTTTYDLIPDADGKSEPSEEYLEAKENALPLSEVVDSFKPRVGGSKSKKDESDEADDPEIEEMFK